MSKADATLITTRRNFLVRATAFTAAGAAVAIPIVAAARGPDLITYHLGELKKAFADYYGADAKVQGTFNEATPASLFPRAHPTWEGAEVFGGTAVVVVWASRSPIEGETVRWFRDSGGPLLAADAGKRGRS